MSLDEVRRKVAEELALRPRRLVCIRLRTGQTMQAILAGHHIDGCEKISFVLPDEDFCGCVAMEQVESVSGSDEEAKPRSDEEAGIEPQMDTDGRG